MQANVSKIITKKSHNLLSISISVIYNDFMFSSFSPFFIAVLYLLAKASFSSNNLLTIKFNPELSIFIVLKCIGGK